MSLVTLAATFGTLLFLRDNPGGRTDPGRQSGMETIRNLLSRSAIRALVVFRVGFSFGKMAVLIFVPIYAATAFGMSAIVVSGILAGGKLTKALTQGVIGGYIDRIGNKHRFVAAGALIYVLGTAMIPLAKYADGMVPAVTIALPSSFAGSITLVPAFFVLFASYSMCGIADSLRLPASMALFVEEGEHFDAVAGSLSLRSISWKAGQVIGPITVGVIWDATGVVIAFLTAAGFIALSTIVFVSLYTLEPAPAAKASPADD